MGGKRPQKLRVYGEPNINSSKAIPYSTFHQTWQSRISKENLALLSDEQIASFSAAPDLERHDTRDYTWVPTGLHHSRNNSSSSFARTFSGGSWHTSGGIRSMQRDSYGDPMSKDKAEALRMYKASLSRKAWQQRSMPSLRDFGPGSQTVAANVARAKMNRSVASVLRAAEEAEPPVGTPTPLMVGRTPTPLPLGERRQQLASISAEVMRAAPNRSIASVLRHGREGDVLGIEGRS